MLYLSQCPPAGPTTGVMLPSAAMPPGHKSFSLKNQLRIDDEPWQWRVRTS